MNNLQNPKISVIVPIYNNINFIDRIVKNINIQTYKDFQVIFVDDGSSDGSGEALDKLTEKDISVPFKVFHQENQGVSVARNKGISLSDGEFLCFIDADDYISEIYLENLYSAITKGECQVAMAYITKDLTRLKTDITENISIFSKTKFLQEFLYSGIKYSICAGIYEKACLEKLNLSFPEGFHYSEDVFLLWNLFSRLDKICVVPQEIYCYYENPSSAMNKKMNLNRKQAIELMTRLEPVMKENAPSFADEFCKFAVSRHHWSILWQAASNFNRYKDFKEYTGNFDMKEELRKLFDYPQKKISLSSKLFCFSRYIYYILMRLYTKLFK